MRQILGTSIKLSDILRFVLVFEPAKHRLIRHCVSVFFALVLCILDTDVYHIPSSFPFFHIKWIIQGGWVYVCVHYACELGNWHFSSYILICSSRRRNLKCAPKRQQVSSVLMDFNFWHLHCNRFFASVAFQLPATMHAMLWHMHTILSVYRCLLVVLLLLSLEICVVHYTCPFRPLFVLPSPSGGLLSVMHVQRSFCMCCMQSCMYVCFNCSLLSTVVVCFVHIDGGLEEKAAVDSWGISHGVYLFNPIRSIVAM